MTTIDWIRQYAPGYCELSEDERNAITQFLFLWSLFEARALNTRANTNAIVEASKKWADNGQLTEKTFERELSYFQDRYYTDNGFTDHFDNLHLRQNDAPDLVARFLRNECAGLADVAAALLIIVYRFRNNLFHGVKWAYEIQGQLDNFNHANSVLMQAIELHGKSATRE